MSNKHPPEFVRFENGCAMRRAGTLYYRHGGDWYVGWKWDGDKLCAAAVCNNTRHLEGMLLFATTEKFWRESNGPYAPKKRS